VGNYLVSLLKDAGHEVVGYSTRDGFDVRDYETLRTVLVAFQPTRVFHLAAQAFVPESGSSPIRGLEVNTAGTLHLLEALRHTGLRPRVLITDTSESYGYDSQPGPEVTEESPTLPTTPYGVNKLAAGLYGLAYSRAYGIPVVVTRAFNHTGPGHSSAFAVPSFARRVVEVERGLAETLRVGNLDAVRNYTDVRDVVRAYVLAIDAAPGVYNVCSDATVSMSEVLGLLCEAADVTPKVEVDLALYRPTPSGATFWPPSHKKLTEATGWEPQISLNETLQALLDDWRARL
jgi:nucleoside-diphosphate-sugar epimerase